MARDRVSDFCGTLLQNTITDRLRDGVSPREPQSTLAHVEGKNPIIPNSQPEVFSRWAKLLHIADAASQIIVNRVENSQCGLAVDGQKLSLCIGRPNNCLAIHQRGFTPNLRRISSWETPSPREMEA